LHLWLADETHEGTSRDPSECPSVHSNLRRLDQVWAEPQIYLATVNALILAMRDEKAAPRARGTLERIGQPAVDPLIVAMKQDLDPDVREHAARALGDLLALAPRSEIPRLRP